MRFTLILAIQFLYWIPVNAQNTREVILEQTDTITRLHILIQNPEITFRKTKDYYWYHKNKLLTSQGSWSGKLVHGHSEAFYPNDNLYWQGSFDHGLKQGQWKQWYANGKLNRIEYWDNGLKNGQFEQYNKAGELIEKGSYKKDKLVGTVYFYQEGKLTSKKRYKKGQVLEQKAAKAPKEKTKKEKKEPKTKKEKPTKKEAKPKVKKEKKAKKLKHQTRNSFRMSFIANSNRISIDLF